MLLLRGRNLEKNYLTQILGIKSTDPGGLVLSYFEIFSAALCVICVETALFNAEITETRRGPPR